MVFYIAYATYEFIRNRVSYTHELPPYKTTDITDYGAACIATISKQMVLKYQLQK